jgi:hypothetical protein
MGGRPNITPEKLNRALPFGGARAIDSKRTHTDGKILVQHAAAVVTQAGDGLRGVGHSTSKKNRTPAIRARHHSGLFNEAMKSALA